MLSGDGNLADNPAKGFEYRKPWNIGCVRLPLTPA